MPSARQRERYRAGRSGREWDEDGAGAETAGLDFDGLDRVGKPECATKDGFCGICLLPVEQRCSASNRT